MATCAFSAPREIVPAGVHPRRRWDFEILLQLEISLSKAPKFRFVMAGSLAALA
jgi:hypothetical protein